MSISWELLADAAVLPGIPKGPFRRFTPHAAHRRLERVCKGSFLPLISRMVLLSFNALVSDPRGCRAGLGSLITREA